MKLAASMEVSLFAWSIIDYTNLHIHLPDTSWWVTPSLMEEGVRKGVHNFYKMFSTVIMPSQILVANSSYIRNITTQCMIRENYSKQ